MTQIPRPEIDVDYGETKALVHLSYSMYVPPTIYLGKASEDNIIWALDHEFTHWLFLDMFGEEEGFRLNDMFDSGVITKGKREYYIRYLAEPQR